MEEALLKIIFFFIISINVFSSEEVDFSSVDRLSEIRQEREKRIKKSQIDRVERFTSLRREIKIDDILASDLESVVIVEGKSIIHYQSNKSYKFEHNQTVQVYKQQDDFGYFYLKQKNGLIRFKVHRTDIHFLTHVVKMYEEPTYYEPEKFEKKFQYYDKNLYTTHTIGFDVDFVSSKFTSEVLGENRPIQGQTTTYSYSYLTDWSFPVDFGVIAKAENTSYSKGLYDSIVNRTLSLGPTLKSKGFWLGQREFKLMTRFTASLVSRLTTRYLGGLDRYDLKTYSFEVGIENHIKNFLGTFILGASFKKRWVELDQTTSSSFINDLNTNDTSFGFYIAQKFGKK
jgi:hypothetical protein